MLTFRFELLDFGLFVWWHQAKTIDFETRFPPFPSCLPSFVVWRRRRNRTGCATLSTVLLSGYVSEALFRGEAPCLGRADSATALRCDDWESRPHPAFYPCCHYCRSSCSDRSAASRGTCDLSIHGRASTFVVGASN